ncbi:hypothetical protein DPMN_134561 [Dreissena polymorpha]|uniref:Uncharacterized protein n=1 Tax=Dreissena polymorpha TaxID=45954 RepID=A0A9D4JFX1_DREPO|nr:hypothetical protein DPMN_134561 [Dreissena polymorpha]
MITEKNDEILDAMKKTLQYQQELFNTYLNVKQEDQTLKNYLIKISETTLDMLKNEAISPVYQARLCRPRRGSRG